MRTVPGTPLPPTYLFSVYACEGLFPMVARLRIAGRLLLCGFLLPLALVIATPGTSEARGIMPMAAGDWHEVEANLVRAAAPDVNCWFAVSKPNQAINVANGWCVGGIGPINDGYAEPGTPGRMWALGPGCDEEAAPYSFTWGDYDAGYNHAGSIPDGSWMESADCDPTNVCIEANPDGLFTGSHDAIVSCPTVDMGEAEPSSCQYGRPIGVDLQDDSFKNSITNWHADVTASADVGEGTTWYALWVYRLASDPVGSHRVQRLGSIGADGTANFESANWKTESHGPFHTYGVQIVSDDGELPVQPPYVTDTMDHRYLSFGNTTQQQNWTRPEAGEDGRLGTTNDAGCWYYYGERITDFDGEDDEQPTSGDPGDLGAAEPDPNPPTAEPETEDDGGWWWRQLLGVMHDIWEAITDFLGAIKDALQWAFVPDWSVIADSMGGVRDAWAETSPVEAIGVVRDTMEAIAPSPGGGGVQVMASGCAGPTVTVPTIVGDGSADLHPFSTCSEGMAQLSNIVKISVTVLVWLGAFLTSARVMAAALGIDVEFRERAKKGGDY